MLRLTVRLKKSQLKKSSTFTTKEEMSNLFMAYCSDHTRDNTVWLVDTGCSNYMTCKMRLFIQLDESHRHKVRLGNDQEHSIDGLVIVALKDSDGGVQLLHEV